MALDSKHPQYTEAKPDWLKMRHAHAGERTVKEQGELYLPATPGQTLDGMTPGAMGYNSYQKYKARAVFPNYVSEAVKAMVGVMHNKEAVIELPPAMEGMRARATINGESLSLLLRRINEAQLTTGRIGLLLDLPSTPGADASPYIATYDAERVTNWDNGIMGDPTLQNLNLVVLDESEMERQTNFEWLAVAKHRVLVLGGTQENESKGLYRQGLFRDTNADYSEEQMIIPEMRGRGLDEIPFVFINSTDLLPEPLNPPLLELANLCFTIYRGEADYRWTLFMQSQETLVIIGGNDEEEYRVGAGAAIILDQNGDAKYIGVAADGLSEQREAIENDKKRAAEIGAQLLDTTSREKESGEALRIRVAAQTTTLNQVALAGAEGLQTLLRIAAKWIGADPKLVNVKPNLDFADKGLTPSEFLQLAQGKAAGLPISEESLHERLKEQGLTNKDYADEVLLLSEERNQALATM
jgi:hypothetical protein